MTIGTKHPHYHKDVKHLETIDVYRVLHLFNVTDPCIQHAVKKLLVAGGRGAGKDVSKDIQEAIDSLNRWQEMRKEDYERKVLLNQTFGKLGVEPSEWYSLKGPLINNKTAAQHAAVRKVLQFHKLTEVGDAVVEADLIVAVMGAAEQSAAEQHGCHGGEGATLPACKDHRPVTHKTGDGTPVEFCPNCGQNEIVGSPNAPD